MIDKNEIPSGWEVVKLGEVCDKISLNGIKIKQKNYLTLGKFPVIDQGQELIGGYFNDESLVVKGEPPFIIFGDHTKVKKYINFKFIAGADGIKVLKPHSIYEAKFFYYLIHAVKIPDRGYARHFQFLEQEEIPLPPFKEQERILAKMEDLFSDLDKGIESLEKAQQQLKVYRQAVLKWAFEGKLTKENLFVTKPLSTITEVKDGTHDTPKYINEGIPFVTQKNVRESGLTFENTQFITQIDHDKFFKRSNVSFDDILISMIGANRGMTCLVNSKRVFSIKNVGLIKALPQEYDKKYLLYYLKSPYAKKYIKSLSKGNAQDFVGLTELRNFPIIYCQLSEQQKIVKQIERRLSVCDKIEEIITNSLLQAEALRLSIIKKAFEGKLVKQNQKDEPATKLLERIRAEKMSE